MEKAQKYHKLISFCIGLLFLIVLQGFASPLPVFRFLVPAFMLYAAAMFVYNRWYLKKLQKYNLWLALRPLFLATAAFGVFLVIPSPWLRGLFLILSVGLITLSEIIMESAAENLLLIETLIIAFGAFFTLAGLEQYAPSLGIYFVLAVFVSVLLLTRSFYEFVPQDETVKMVNSAVLALFCAEVFWALSFLPPHFSALSLILANIFYFCLIVNYYNFFHILSLKKIQFHLFLILACTLLVLISTRWSIIQ